MSRLNSFLFFYLVVIFCYTSVSAAVPRYAYPLSVNGTNIVDTKGTKVQLRCANWPGHIDTMTPEGLQWLPVDQIVAMIVGTNVFNCIRLTYSVDLFFQGANLTLKQSFLNLNLSDTVNQIQKNNPTLVDLPLLKVFDAVVAACNNANIMVLFDNQVSKPMWCCSTTDGNGWWNDQYFNVDQWLHSLSAMSANFYNRPGYESAVAFSLRNELRTSKGYSEQLNDWYKYVPQGIDALQSSNPTALKFISGLDYDCNLVFLNDSGSNMTEWNRVFKDYEQHLVFEAHIYSWSGFGTPTDNCSLIMPAYNHQLGWPLDHNRPLVLTELGLAQANYPQNHGDYLYWHCVESFILEHDLGFGIWLFGGSYYIRSGQPNAPDGFGTVNADFTKYASPTFLTELQKLIINQEEKQLIE